MKEDVKELEDQNEVPLISTDNSASNADPRSSQEWGILNNFYAKFKIEV